MQPTLVYNGDKREKAIAPEPFIFVAKRAYLAYISRILWSACLLLD